MSEQTITGVCTEVANKPGSDWYEFHIDAGGKWPVKLATKLQPLIELGKAAGGNLATWTYNEVESEKINEKSGKPFVNRYLERVEVGGAQTQTDATDSPAAQKGPALGAEKDRLIVRQTCIKAAAELHAGKGDDQAVMMSAAAFEKWVVTGILEDLPF